MSAEDATGSLFRPDLQGKGDVKEFETMLSEVEEATVKEHQMGLLQALKLYPKASMWSILLSLTVVMEGYDVILLGSFYAYPEFVRTFGFPNASGTYQIPARWQAGLTQAANLGGMVGLLINGWAAERFGYRPVMIVALVAMIGFIFLFFFATSLQMLLVAEVFCAIPWGIFQALAITYAAEVAPVALRGYLTCWVNACWGIGQLISLGVLRGLLHRTDQWGWRIPYAIQWVWPIPLLVVAFLAPESPWWLIRKGRIEDARRSLERLTSHYDGDGFDLDQTIAMMRHTHNLETEMTAGASYLDCFRGVNLRRTEAVLGAWAVQPLCGSAFLSYSTYFFEQAGLPSTISYDLSIIQYSINFGGVLLAWFIMSLGVGRRLMYLWGCVGMGSALLIIGGVGTISSHSQPAAYAASVMLLMWSASYQTTVGTVCYSLVAELSSRRLAIKTVSLGRFFYHIIGIVNGTITPYMLNPTAWNWGAKTAFFWFGFNIICIVWIFYRLPEPNGLTYGELDKLFEERVPARQFHKVKIDLLEHDRERLESAKNAVIIDQITVKQGDEDYL